MKIAKVDTHLIRLPYTTGGGGNIGNMDWSTLDYVLVRIETADGLVGWGDAFAPGGTDNADSPPSLRPPGAVTVAGDSG